MTATEERTLIARKDVRSFDDEAWKIINDAQAAGWSGRVSTKGHAIMSAPDGQATMSVSRDSLRGRSGRNARAELDRWIRANDQEAIAIGEAMDAMAHERVRAILKEAIDPDGEAGDDGRAKVHALALEDERTLEYMHRSYVAFKDAAGHRPNMVFVTNNLDGDDAPVRPWRVQWVLYDKAVNTVVSFGGPKMDAAKADVAMWEHLTPNPPEQTLYACSQCESSLPTDRALGAHVRAAHTASDQCPVCDKTFQRVAMHLRVHAKTHRKCPQCSKWVTIRNLSGHMRSQHDMRMDRSLGAVPVEGADAPVGVADSQDDQSPQDEPNAAPGGATRPLWAVSDPVDAVRALIVEVETLRERVSDTQDVQRQIETLTAERDACSERARKAEGNLEALRSMLSDL